VWWVLCHPRMNAIESSFARSTKTTTNAIPVFYTHCTIHSFFRRRRRRKSEEVVQFHTLVSHVSYTTYSLCFGRIPRLAHSPSIALRRTHTITHAIPYDHHSVIDWSGGSCLGGGLHCTTLHYTTLHTLFHSYYR
jgi:hypothetical protein